MTKRSSWILVLSALLCISMLFVSCGSDNTEADDLDTSDTTSETPKDEKEPIPESERVNYSAIYEQWSKYIGYEASAEEEEIKANLLYSYEENGAGANRVTEDFFYQVSISDALGGSPTVRIFSRSTGEEIRYKDASESSDTVYNFYYFYCVVRVQKYNAASNVTTYDYYDANGEKLNASSVAAADQYTLSEEAVDDYGEYKYVKVGEKVYLISYGEILATFDRGEEHPIQYTNTEYGSYKYYIPNGLHTETIYIVDSNEHVTARYKMKDGYDLSNATVLENGDVLVQYLSQCTEDEALYTFETVNFETTYPPKTNDNLKWIACYEIIDAETGEVTDVPVTFKIANLITPASKEDKNVSLKGEYQYAEINKIVDGKLSQKTVPVILDNEMNVVEELTPFIKNQSGMVKVLDENSFLVYAVTPLEDNYSYRTSLQTLVYKVSASGADLYINENKTYYDESVYTSVANGFIYGQKLYNDRLESLYDLSDSEYRILFEDAVLRVDVRDEEGAMEQQIVFIENNELKSIALGDETDSVTPLCDVLSMQSESTRLGKGFKVTVRDESGFILKYVWYTAKGEVLFEGEQIEPVTETEDSCLIRCSDNGVVTYYVIR